MDDAAECFVRNVIFVGCIQKIEMIIYRRLASSVESCILSSNLPLLSHCSFEKIAIILIINYFIQRNTKSFFLRYIS